MCSTPGGVIGIGTRARTVNLGPQYSVLNAWRRHWNRHQPVSYRRFAAVTSAQRLAASLESAPDDAQSTNSDSQGAQRLAASLESARPHHSRRRSRGNVLNAWRRHWNRHDSSRLGRDEECHSAQRLAASLESAHWRLRSNVSLTCDVLNAWRRHWNRHLLSITGVNNSGCAQRLAASLESAPRNLMPRLR